MRRREIQLNAEQRAELEKLRDYAPKAYVRERAAAILKVAEQQVASQVAQHGLLKVRQPETVYQWLDRYEAEGVNGLYYRPGRGRKASFFPQKRG